MDDDVKQKYIEAGRIAKEARELGRDMLEPRTKFVAITNAVEAFIRDEGAHPAFPVNISVDAVAAHYTPSIDDDATLDGSEVVNIDVGVHVDGYIGDTAVTVDLSGDHGDLVDASADAVANALDIVEPGLNVGEIGAVIQETIEDEYGFKPIRNLSGHGVDQYVQHAGNTIPNIATDTGTTLERGEAVAIEPFATTGAGAVTDGKPGNIYRLENDRVRGRMERKVLGQITNQFRSLPFAARWIDSIPKPRVQTTVSKLVRKGNLHAYDVLKEEDDGRVSQKEHTVLVLDDPIVTTRG
jgi:methionyl aminopeptidase